jgi:ABC-type glycerol-3-phosphate transport system substrate-binding protein
LRLSLNISRILVAVLAAAAVSACAGPTSSSFVPTATQSTHHSATAQDAFPASAE